MTPPELLSKYLRAADTYGHRAGQIDERFCREALGIDDPRGAVLALARQGVPVRYTDDGTITFQREGLR